VVLRDTKIISLEYDMHWLVLFILVGLIMVSMRFKQALD
jgi:hypothetical protein